MVKFNGCLLHHPHMRQDCTQLHVIKIQLQWLNKIGLYLSTGTISPRWRFQGWWSSFRKPSRTASIFLPLIFLICYSYHVAFVLLVQVDYSSFKQEKLERTMTKVCASLLGSCLSRKQQLSLEAPPCRDLTYVSLASTGSLLVAKESREVKFSTQVHFHLEQNQSTKKKLETECLFRNLKDPSYLSQKFKHACFVLKTLRNCAVNKPVYLFLTQYFSNLFEHKIPYFL